MAALRSLTKKLEVLKLTDFPGENVTKATSFVRGPVSLMKSNKALSVDIEDVSFTIFKYCSTKEFVSFVSFMANMRSFKTNEVVARMSYDDLLLSLENKFTNLRAQEK